MTIGEKIKQERIKRGMTQDELAHELGYKSRTSINKIETGKRDIPRSQIKQIAKILDVSPLLLLGFEDEKPANKTFEPSVDALCEDKISDRELTHIKKYRTLDVYGKKLVDNVLDMECERCADKDSGSIEILLCSLPASAGLGEFLSDELSKIIEIPDTPLNRSADFVVQVNGDSMRPDFDDDDYLLVHKQPQVYEGEIGIFVINGCGYVKRFGGDRLESLNEKYDDIVFSEYDNVVCYGKVIGKV